eukprot:4272961-Pleurochrysis_carterae.AAC.1
MTLRWSSRDVQLILCAEPSGFGCQNRHAAEKLVLSRSHLNLFELRRMYVNDANCFEKEAEKSRKFASMTTMWNIPPCSSSMSLAAAPANFAGLEVRWNQSKKVKYESIRMRASRSLASIRTRQTEQK